MAGASGSTRPVSVINANWDAGSDGGDGGDGTFSFMIVTDDEHRHVSTPSPTAATALLALRASPAKLLWDPESRTVIAAGVRGRWLD